MPATVLAMIAVGIISVLWPTPPPDAPLPRRQAIFNPHLNRGSQFDELVQEKPAMQERNG